MARTPTIVKLQKSISRAIAEYVSELKRERVELTRLLRTTETPHIVDHINKKLSDVNDELDKLNHHDIEFMDPPSDETDETDPIFVSDKERGIVCGIAYED